MTREPGAPIMLKVLEFLTARTIQEGSKTLVDGASRGEEAHGKFLNQKIATKVVLPLTREHTDRYSPGSLVTSTEGLQLRQKVWSEVSKVLRAAAPESEIELR